MENIYPVKTAILLLFILCSAPLFAEAPAEYCGLANDTIQVETDHSRYTISIEESIETLILENLNPGDEYALWISSPEVAPECLFDLSTIHPKQTDVIAGNVRLDFKANATTQVVYIQNANCTPNSSYHADISISRKAENPEETNNLNMMGIMTDQNYTTEELIQEVFIGGGCFEVSNVQPIGNFAGRGHFTSGTSSINIDEGVILASGNITNSAGPNNTTSITTDFFDNSGDPDLNILATGQVYDAVGIEFDFTPVVPVIQFEYVFASDEYCDYVNTGFNDAFGFFISGPGFSGPYTNGGENIAVVPGTATEISINTINIQTNSAYYVDNVPIGQPQNAGGCVAADLNNPGAAEQDIEYDGFTTVLTATANVQVCETYHIRLVVGDVNDGIFDSAVFLAANSFDAGGDVAMDIDLPGLGGSGIAYEGCAGDGYIIFERPPDSDLSLPLTVFFNIAPGSTATNGVDFTNLPPSITIPAGETQFLLPLEIFEDFIIEGTETLILELDNPCTCDDASIEIQIQDTPPMTVSSPDLEFCNETTTTLLADVEGGVPGYTYSWSTGGNGPSITIDATTGTQTFTVTVTDECGNQEISTSTVTVQEEAYAFIEGFVEICEGNPTGILTINFTGAGPWDLTYAIDGVPQVPIIGITDNPYFLEVSEIGVYTIIGLFVNGCPGTSDGSGIVLPTIFESFIIPTSVSCPENFDGALDLLMTGGAPDYTYEWSNDQYTEDLDNLPPGSYYVTVTDMNGCTHIDSSEVLTPDTLLLELVEVEGVNCLDSLSGSVDLTVNGGTPGYDYEWDTGSTEEDPMDLSAGPHTVTVTDSLGCISEAMIVVSQDSEPPTAEAEVSGILNCDELMISIDGSNSSGADSLGYVWIDSNGDTLSMENLIETEVPGDFTLVVTNLENGCNDETTVTVEQDITPPEPEATGGLLTCDETEVLLDGSGSSGTGVLTYSWVDSDGEEVGSDSTLSVSEAGMYTLIITDDSNGCTSETTAQVDENIEDPEPQADPSGPLTCSDETITIDGSSSSGNGPIIYTWIDTNGDTLSDDTQIEVTDPGEYTLIITDTENGCTAETTAIVDQNTEDPVPDAVADGNLDCVETSIYIDGAGSSGNGTINYQWLDNGTEIGTGSGVDVTTPGTYTLIVTDEENGCSAETEVTVDQNIEEPIPEATVDGLLNCEELMVTVDGSGSTGNGTILYEWTDSNGDVVSNDPDFEVEDPGTFTLVITDEENGCTAETSVTVDQDIEDPVADAGENGILNCNETSVELDGSGSSEGGNIVYQWTNESDEIVGEESTVEVSDPGTYTILVTNTENGCTSVAQVIIDADENEPEPEAEVQGIINCNTPNATIDGSASSGNGPLTYEWLDESDTVFSEDPSTSVNEPGTYTLIITDTDNGCTAITTVEVLENIDEPNPDILDPDVLTCNTTTIDLDGSNSSGMGTIGYQWENSNGDDLGNSPIINVSAPGTYMLTITDSENGCTSTSEVIVDQNIEEPLPDAVAGDMLTCTTSSVLLDGSGSNGQGVLQYQWLDQNGDPIGNEMTNETTTPGTYTLIVTNETNGCTAETTVTVDQDISDPVAAASSNGFLNCAVSSIQIDGSGSTGDHPIDYQWLDINGDPVSTAPDYAATEAGTYTLIVTDQVNGCTSVTSVDIDANYDTPQPDAVADGILTCENLSVSIDGTGSSSSGNITYQWFDENNIEISTDSIIDIGTIGNYTLVITDQVSACSESVTVLIDEDVTPPVSNAGPDNTLTCDISSVELDGSGSSSGTNINYEWTSPGGVIVSTDITAEATETGIYILLVTNTENGCTASSEVEVVPDAALPNADANVSTILTCDVLEVMLDGNGSSSGTNISYQWLDQNGSPLDTDLEIIVGSPGTYTLIVTDGTNGCTSVASIEVEQDITPPLANPGPSPTLTCDETEVMLDGSGSTSSSGNLDYEWFDPNAVSIGNTISTQVDMAGIYTLVVTAENGCTHSAEVEVLLDANVPVSDPGENGLLDCDITVITLGGPNTTTGPDITYEWINSNNTVVGTGATIDVTTPDTYTLIVYNPSNNCETSAQVVIDQDVILPQVDVGAGGLLTCDQTQVELGGIGSSSGAEFQYEWTNSNGQVVSTDSVYSTIEPDTYTLTVFNTQNGCESSEDVTINQDIVAPNSDAGPGGILTCDITEIMLDGTNSTGSNITFDWYNDAGVLVDSIAQIQVSETGVYTLIVTNQDNGCTSESTVEVIPDANLPEAIAMEDGILTCDISEVLIDAGNSTSISGNIGFEWLDPNGAFLTNDPDAMVGVPGIYTVIVTDTDNGCTATALIEVPQDIENPEALAGENDTLTCTITQLQLNGSATNGITFDFEWLDETNATIGQSSSININNPGIYTLIVTNTENGCTAIDQVEIIPDTDLPDAVAGIGGTLTCIVDAVILDGSGSEQGSTIEYEWQGPGGSTISNEVQVEVDQPGIYTIVVTDSENDCVSQDEVLVDQDINDPLAAIDGIGPLELNCDVDEVVLNADASVPFNELDFNWSTSNGNITTTTNTNEIEVNQPGTYNLFVTNQLNGCTDTEIYIVDQDVTPPTAFINVPDVINCYEPEIIINAVNTSGSGNFEFSWNAADGSGIIDGETSLDLTVNESGIYILTIENLDNGCDHSEEIEVIADLDAPDAVASVEDMLDCVTPSVQLSGAGSSLGTGFSYEWQGTGIVSGANSLSPTVSQTGSYTLIVTNFINGCTSSDDVFVFENNNQPNGVTLDVIPPPCPGDQASIEILNVSGGEGPYVYSIDGGENFYDITFFFGLDAGNYDLVIQDVIGCEYEEFINIPYPDNVFIQAELDLEIELGDTVELNALSNIPEWALASIQWTPGASLSCDTCLTTLAYPSSTTHYTITIENENGCPATDDIILRVRKERGIYIPNVFSPHNLDGINDIFFINSDGKSVENIEAFKVYDRWGEVVFEDYDFMPDDPTHGWDGILRGEPMNPAVFVYWAKVTFIDGETILFKGDVTLVR